MNDNIKEMLKDFEIEESEGLDVILNKVADRWQIMKKDSCESQTVSFQANCKCQEECCSSCEKRWMGKCQTTCYTFNFDCCNCPKNK